MPRRRGSCQKAQVASRYGLPWQPLGGIGDKGALEPPSLERVAYHEAGHAVAHIWLGVPFRWASIKPDANSYGRVTGPSPLRRLIDKRLDGDKLTPKEWVRVEKEIVAIYAGSAAEAEYLQRNDLVNLDNLTGLVLGALDDQSINIQIATQLQSDDTEVGDAWLTYLRLRASSLVRWQWIRIEHVAAQLLKRTTLSAKQVQAAYLESIKPSPGSVFYASDDT